MLKYSSESNWANNILDLRRKYNLPLKDENISNMSKPVWKSIVKRQIQYYVFNCLLESCHSNRKIALLRYNKFKSVDYLMKLDPPIARILIKARLRMFEVKINLKRNITTNSTVHSVLMKQRLLTTFSSAPMGSFAPSLSGL